MMTPVAANEAIILAGGAGTRLRSVVSDRPKPMADVAGRPFLAHLLDYLALQRVERVVLSVGYMHEQITTYFGNVHGKLAIEYSVEQEPLGTGGAIRQALSKVEGETVVVLNGDTYFPVDLTKMREKHLQQSCRITMALKEMLDFDRYGSVSVNSELVTGFTAKGYRAQGYINGGVYMINRDMAQLFPPLPAFSFEKDVLEKIVCNTNICCFISDRYFVDIGIPEDYHKAQTDFSISLPQ